MKKFFLIMTGMLFCSMAWSQEVPAKDNVEGSRSEALTNLRLATDLVRYGYKQQEALPLIQALEILNNTDTQPLEAETDGNQADTSNNTGKTGFVTMDTKQILKDAKKFSDGDKSLEKLLAKVEKETNNGTRGAVGGPCKDYAAVKAYSTYTWTCSFIANRLAEVAVYGDGDTDLDLYIYDSNGNLIASDTDYSDDCYVSWVPRWTGKYYIKIVNRGGVYNRYVILTN